MDSGSKQHLFRLVSLYFIPFDWQNFGAKLGECNLDDYTLAVCHYLLADGLFWPNVYTCITIHLERDGNLIITTGYLKHNKHLGCIIQLVSNQVKLLKAAWSKFILPNMHRLKWTTCIGNSYSYIILLFRFHY